MNNSTLRKYKVDPGFLVQEAKMIYSASQRPTLVVEGEHDYRLYRQWLIDEHARLECVDGKPHVETVWRTAKQRGVTSVYCLVDLDFDEIASLKKIADPQYIYVSLDESKGCAGVECNDLESALVKGRPLTKILSQKYRWNDVVVNFQWRVNELRENLRIAALTVGAFRAADANVYGRTRKSPIGGDFPIDDLFFDAISVKVDFDRVSDVLRRSSRAGAALMDEVISLASEYRLKYKDCWRLCRGHDLTFMLASHLGVALDRRVTQREIEESLRMACELDIIRDTHFGAKLFAIGAENGRSILGPVT